MAMARLLSHRLSGRLVFGGPKRLYASSSWMRNLLETMEAAKDLRVPNKKQGEVSSETLMQSIFPHLFNISGVWTPPDYADNTSSFWRYEPVAALIPEHCSMLLSYFFQRRKFQQALWLYNTLIEKNIPVANLETQLIVYLCLLHNSQHKDATEFFKEMMHQKTFERLPPRYFHVVIFYCWIKNEFRSIDILVRAYVHAKRFPTRRVVKLVNALKCRPVPAKEALQILEPVWNYSYKSSPPELYIPRFVANMYRNILQGLDLDFKILFRGLVWEGNVEGSSNLLDEMILKRITPDLDALETYALVLVQQGKMERVLTVLMEYLRLNGITTTSFSGNTEEELMEFALNQLSTTLNQPRRSLVLLPGAWTEGTHTYYFAALIRALKSQETPFKNRPALTTNKKQREDWKQKVSKLLNDATDY